MLGRGSQNTSFFPEFSRCKGAPRCIRQVQPEPANMHRGCKLQLMKLHRLYFASTVTYPCKTCSSNNAGMQCCQSGTGETSCPLCTASIASKIFTRRLVFLQPFQSHGECNFKGGHNWLLLHTATLAAGGYSCVGEAFGCLVLLLLLG